MTGTRLRRTGSGGETITDSAASPSDDELVATARTGDLEAFNRLVERHQRVVYAVCFRLLRDPQLAEDVTQDTFVRAYQSLARFQGDQFRSWLLRIATNRSFDVLRYRRRRQAESLDAQLIEEEPQWASEAPSDDPEEFSARRELSRRLDEALGRLPPEQRLVVLLHDVQGYPYEEIALITSASLGTVKSRLSRGRARLRDELRGDPAARELLGGVSRQLSSDERG